MPSSQITLIPHFVDIYSSAFYDKEAMGFFDKLSSLTGEKKTTTTTTEQNAPAPPKKVLIVEDDKDLRDFYSELLTGEGFTVITAPDGVQGLQAAVAQKPDIFMLDLMMPVMDGKTLLHKLRAMPEFVKSPVIILTNAGDADNIRQTQFFDNANDFLIKSNVTPDEIIARIKTFS